LEVPVAPVLADGWVARLSAWLQCAHQKVVPAVTAVDADDAV